MNRVSLSVELVNKVLTKLQDYPYKEVNVILAELMNECKNQPVAKKEVKKEDDKKDGDKKEEKEIKE